MNLNLTEVLIGGIAVNLVWQLILWVYRRWSRTQMQKQLTSLTEEAERVQRLVNDRNSLYIYLLRSVTALLWLLSIAGLLYIATVASTSLPQMLKEVLVAMPLVMAVVGGWVILSTLNRVASYDEYTAKIEQKVTQLRKRLAD